MIVKTENMLWRLIKPRDLILVSELYENWGHATVTMNDVQAMISASQKGGVPGFRTFVAVDYQDLPIGVWSNQQIDENKVIVHNLLFGPELRGRGLFREAAMIIRHYWINHMELEEIEFNTTEATTAVQYTAKEHHWAEGVGSNGRAKFTSTKASRQATTQLEKYTVEVIEE